VIEQFDVIVIGAGPAGETLAGRRAAHTLLNTSEEFEKPFYRS